MNLCIIGKYPPIVGGVSRNTYWLANGLAESGAEVHVVTNAQEVESEYRSWSRRFSGDDPSRFSATAQARLFVHTTDGSPVRYIPWANPYVTKLASVACRVVREHACDFILGYYLEPYGLAAYLAAQWTGIPYGLRHAGSDIGRLMLSTDLRTSYREVIVAADFLIANQTSYRGFLRLGVDAERVYLLPRLFPPDTIFHPAAAPMDIAAISAELGALPTPIHAKVYQRQCERPYNPTLPVIGVYGKAGETKGTYDLVHALGQLKGRGHRFNFLAMCQGPNDRFARLVDLVVEYGIEQDTWFLPFVPHWEVPSFIRACDAVCCLERGFPIRSHTPEVPNEVVACATCLIVSPEVASKQAYAAQLAHGYNAFIVDPRHETSLVGALETVVTNPLGARKIGSRGHRELWTVATRFRTWASECLADLRGIYQDIIERRDRLSIAEMQACLARLCADETFRRLCEHNPSVALDDYKLTENERQALLSIDRRMLVRFAQSLTQKRRAKLASAYPLTFSHLPQSELDRYYGRYHQLYPDRSGERFQEQAWEFGRFLEESVATDHDVAAYCPDLVRFERLFFAARVFPTEEDDFKLNYRPEGQQPTSSPSARRPILCEGVYLGAFHYDVLDLVQRLTDGGDLDGLRSIDSFVLFRRNEVGLQPHLFAVDRDSYFVLEMCNGRRTVEDIAADYEGHTGDRDTEPDVLSLLQELEQEGVVRFT